MSKSWESTRETQSGRPKKILWHHSFSVFGRHDNCIYYKRCTWANGKAESIVGCFKPQRHAALFIKFSKFHGEVDCLLRGNNCNYECWNRCSHNEEIWNQKAFGKRSKIVVCAVKIWCDPRHFTVVASSCDHQRDLIRVYFHVYRLMESSGRP